MTTYDSILDVRFIWNEILDSFGVTCSVKRERAFQSLHAEYSKSHRHYHNLTHISFVLSILLLHEIDVVDCKILYFAAICHDVVYDPKSLENEQQSADVAAKMLREFEIPLSTIERIQQLILFTKDHSAGENDADARLLLDADLAILATPSAMYDEYKNAIRREYDWVAEQAFLGGRRKVLSTFLLRSRIFLSPQFPHWETRAQANITREIAEIDAKLRTLE